MTHRDHDDNEIISADIVKGELLMVFKDFPLVDELLLEGRHGTTTR